MIQQFTLDIPEEIIYIIKTLNNNNHKAYVVGGCIRDSILNKQPKDWDISTSANPNEIKKIFSKTIDTGIKHDTVSVVIDNTAIEITTFRTIYPEEKKCLVTDLSYRDLTINAMAYHPLEGLFDPYLGMKDIKNAVIRAVKDPSERIKEDPLRMIRAVRFSAVLGFDIEKQTLSAIERNSALIENVSQERIRDELTKILTSNQPSKFALLRELKLLKYILPEFDVCFDITQNHPYHVFNVGMHSLKTVCEIENKVYLRWTMLLHDTGKALTKSTDEKGIDHFYGHPKESMFIAKNVLKRLKFDNKTIKEVCHLIRHHDRRMSTSFKSVRKAVSVIGKDSFMDLLKVQKADKKSQNPDFLNSSLEDIYKIKEIYAQINSEKQCLTIKDLKINGSDLLTLGYRQGKEIGDVLNKLLYIVLDNPELNTYDNLIKIAKSSKNTEVIDHDN